MWIEAQLPGRFARMTWFAAGATGLLALALAAVHPIARPLDLETLATQFAMWITFIHFGVGYEFFVRSRLRRRAFATPSVGLGLAVCGAAGAAAYWAWPHSLPVLHILFFLHATENAVYHLSKLSPDHRGIGNALVPVGASIATPALLVAAIFSDARIEIVLAQWGAVGICLAWVARAVSRDTRPQNWGRGWKLVWDLRFVLVGSAVLALGFRFGSLPYALFIVWHVVSWTIFSWHTQPEARPTLVRSHLIFGAIYSALFTLAALGMTLGHPMILALLVGPTGFVAQGVCHILMGFAFRHYEAPLTS